MRDHSFIHSIISRKKITESDDESDWESALNWRLLCFTNYKIKRLIKVYTIIINYMFFEEVRRENSFIHSFIHSVKSD